MVGTVDLTAGRPAEVVIEFATKPSRNLAFAAFRVGIGRPLGDAEIDEAVAAARQAEVALVFVGRNGEWDTEGSDLENIALPGRQDELVAAVAAANPRTVVVLQTGGPVEMPWLDAVPAVLQAWYPGQECGNAIADVLIGAAEPGGRLPQTFPARWADNPTASRDPEVYPGLDGRVRYAEGVFVGYRHYDRAGIAPLFPFGHGLGYTRFELSDLVVAPSRRRRSSQRLADQYRFASRGDRRPDLDGRPRGASNQSRTHPGHVWQILARVWRDAPGRPGPASTSACPLRSGGGCVADRARGLRDFCWFFGR